MKVLWYCHECGRRHVLNHVGVGALYRFRMRLLHRFDLCWMQPTPVEPGRAWCHWCGMRGRKPLPISEVQLSWLNGGNESGDDG